MEITVDSSKEPLFLATKSGEASPISTWIAFGFAHARHAGPRLKCGRRNPRGSFQDNPSGGKNQQIAGQAGRGLCAQYPSIPCGFAGNSRSAAGQEQSATVGQSAPKSQKARRFKIGGLSRSNRPHSSG
jgi:hypothetical protein